MKRNTLYNFNSVQLTFNQCVFNRIQYRTEHNLYSTRLDNSTGNSALQFSLQFGLQFWLSKIVETIRASEQRLYTVVQSGCLVSRPSLADVSRIKRSNGKGNPWQGQFFGGTFSVNRFPIMDLSPGPTPASGHIEQIRNDDEIYV